MTDQARGELVPGGLAVIISAKHCHENIGKIVTLERYVKKGDLIGGYLVDADGWHITGDLVSWNSIGSVRMKHSLAMPYQLMPINPEADPLSIDQRQECEV